MKTCKILESKAFYLVVFSMCHCKTVRMFSLQLYIIYINDITFLFSIFNLVVRHHMFAPDSLIHVYFICVVETEFRVVSSRVI